MKLVDAYRLAVAEGLTAKEAGKKYGVVPSSLQKIKHRYALPSLASEWESKYKGRFANMTDTQLNSYYNALNLPKNYTKCQKEREAVVAEFKLREAPSE
jgi:transposase